MGRKLIFERAIKIDEEGNPISYWPDRWPLKKLLEERLSVTPTFFSVSYQNDPAALEGNVLKINWLHVYTSAELQAARTAANCDRGMVIVGIDPTHGGTTDPDFSAMVALEVINNRGFLLDYKATKIDVETQPQYIEEWCDIWKPDLVKIEEGSNKGFIYTAMTSQVNGGKGSKYPIVTYKPQSNAGGGKQIRLLGMAARFENGQVKLPAREDMLDLEPDPRWDLFIQQWRSFPAGHDDILDACAWACFETFSTSLVASVSIGPDGVLHRMESGNFMDTDEDKQKNEDAPIAKDRGGRPLRPIGQVRERTGLGRMFRGR